MHYVTLEVCLSILLPHVVGTKIPTFLYQMTCKMNAMTARNILLIILPLLTASTFVKAQSCQAKFDVGTVLANERAWLNNTSIYDRSHTVNFTWSINKETPIKKFDTYYAFPAGRNKVCLNLYDSTANCSSTYCDSFDVYERSDCHLEFTMKDTIDSCHVVLIPHISGRDVVDSIQWTFGDGDTVIQSPPSRIVHSYKESGRYYAKLTSFGRGGTCKSSCGLEIYISGCKDSSLCFNLTGGSILYDTASLRDPINFPNPERKMWNATVSLIQNDEKFNGERYTFSCKGCNEYSFDSVCPGTYYVKVALHGDDYNRVNLMPSYWKNRYRWDDVPRPLRFFGRSKRKNQDLNFVRLNKVSGPGSLSGTVANTFKGAPISKVNVIALDEDMKPVAYSATNKKGFFEFKDLPYGSYYVFADVVGMEILGDWVEVSESIPALTDLNITVEDDKAFTSAKSLEMPIEEEALAMYPNPAKDQLVIQMNGFQGMVQILDLNGKLVLQAEMDTQLILNLQEVEPGAYFIMATSKNGEVFRESMVKY